MSEATPVVTQETAPAPEVKEYRYQPKDEQGRNLGGEQVIKYTTQEELVDKLANQNVLLVRKLREESRARRMGVPVDERIPADAERFEGVVEFRPKELSATERFELAQKIVDPERSKEAIDELLESAVGVPPSVLTKTLNEQQMFIMQSRARDNYVDFTNSGADYTDSPDNRKILTDWMWKNRLAPTVSNFSTAYRTLKEAGLLLDGPVVQQVSQPVVPPVVMTPVATEIVEAVANPQPQPEPTPRIESSPGPASKATRPAVPSGLNDRVSSNTGITPAVTGDVTSLTLKQIDAFSPDKLKEAMRNPKFTQHWDKLLSEADKRNRERGLTNF